MKNSERVLKDAGIKPSLQRLMIYDYLRKSKEHPSVDTIFQALNDSIPTLSKTTVYNTLRLLIERGLVQPILIEENEARYDGDTSLHAHFLCNSCGKLYDIFCKKIDIETDGLDDFDTELTQVYYTGLCPKCR